MSQTAEVEVHGVVAPDPRLEVSLTNRTRGALSLYEHGLPWRDSTSMVVIAARTDAVGTVLEQTLPIDDPGPATITIEPGQVLTGNIALCERFPGFLDAIRERDIIVFWSYQLTTVSGSSLPRTGGYVLFPRQAAPPRPTGSSASRTRAVYFG